MSDSDTLERGDGRHVSRHSPYESSSIRSSRTLPGPSSPSQQDEKEFVGPSSTADANDPNDSPSEYGGKEAGSESGDDEIETRVIGNRVISIRTDLQDLIVDARQFKWNPTVRETLESGLQKVKESPHIGLNASLMDSEQPEIFWTLDQFLQDKATILTCWYTVPDDKEHELPWSCRDVELSWKGDETWAEAVAPGTQDTASHGASTGVVRLPDSIRRMIASKFQRVTHSALKDRHEQWVPKHREDREGRKEILASVERCAVTNSLDKYLGRIVESWWALSLKNRSREIDDMRSSDRRSNGLEGLKKKAEGATSAKINAEGEPMTSALTTAPPSIGPSTRLSSKDTTAVGPPSAPDLGAWPPKKRFNEDPQTSRLPKRRG